MTKSKIFLILSLGFLGGVFFASFFDVEFLNYFLALVSVMVFVLGYRNKIIIVSVFAILFFSFGIWRTQSALENISQNIDWDGRDFSGKAVVVKEPAEKEHYDQLIVRPDNLHFKVLVQVQKYKDWKYGDEIEMRCALEKPENFSEDFDYRMYLAKDNILYLCKKGEVSKTEEDRGNKIYNFLLKVKNKMEDNVNRAVPFPEAALADGLLFGGDDRLSDQMKENFSKTGMTHIVAVSGYNVTIIAEYLILAGIFLGFWRPRAFWFAVAGIILFVAMIGFPSSAMRAGVMGTLVLWAAKNGRLANAFNAIIFAGVTMLTFNPLLLRWDVGFQLSFLIGFA
ncbi:MAG: Uncharacterized protein Athens071425_106 [Parcubacteria group bacterium Athens0714_25]|nr:MAG: Uncharacterized protein Athens071425_106 [Parcubacteria group bacterium Athens0714_25]